MYISIWSRPDITYVVSYFSRYLPNFKYLNRVGVKRIIKYLMGTKTFFLTLGGKNLKLQAYIDSY